MGYKKYFTLSFDDGLEQDKRLIQLLKKYSLQCTFNLNGGLFGKHQLVGHIRDVSFLEFPESSRIRRSLFKGCEHHRIPEDEIRQVYGGYEVASHAYQHEALPFLPEDKMKAAIDKDIEALSRITGCTIAGHAYPGGMYSAAAAAYLKGKGIVYGRCVIPNHSFMFPADPHLLHPTCSHASKRVFNYIDQFVSAKPEKDDMLFLMWGHSYEFDYGTDLCNWERIEKIFERIAGHNDIEYCTNQHAFVEHCKTKITA
jgi:Predicted xylanase/chitin deacetylase